MKRRSAVKQIAFMIGGSLWLPSCLPESEKTASSVITDGHEEILSDLVEWLIPETDIPGARELGVHHFVLKMLTDCHDEKTQQQCAMDLGKIAAHAKEKGGDSWEKLSWSEKEKVFGSLVTPENPDQQLESFPVIKRRAIQGFMSSEYILNNVFVYEMAPGRYDGYFPV